MQKSSPAVVNKWLASKSESEVDKEKKNLFEKPIQNQIHCSMVLLIVFCPHTSMKLMKLWFSSLPA